MDVPITFGLPSNTKILEKNIIDILISLILFGPIYVELSDISPR